MKIDDLIGLLDNRLREFQLSRDYARMNGDLERMNMADKEIIGLEDTLYQLNLLMDTSKSAAVREDILSEVITDGSVAVLGEYNITPYATDPQHERKIMNILSKMGIMDTAEKIEDYIRNKYFSSPVTGEMVMSASLAYSVDTRLMMAIMQQDSSFGTAGVAVRTRNPGNVGNNDDGDTVTYESWQEGVTAVAGWLSRHRGSTIIADDPVVTAPEPIATTTPVITTSATTTATTTTPSTATTTPVTVITAPVTTTETEQAATSTPAIDTSPTTDDSQPTATSTPATVITDPVTTSTTTPSTSTSTPLESTVVQDDTVSNGASPSTVETEQVATSTPLISTTTPATATAN